MSTLKVNTIQDTGGGSGSTPAQIKDGRAKMWANLTTTGTDTLNDSYNVSSFSSIGADCVTLNFTTAMSTTTYAVVCSCIEDHTASNSRTPRAANPTRTALVAGSVTVSASDFDSNNQNVSNLFVVVFGD